MYAQNGLIFNRSRDAFVVKVQLPGMNINSQAISIIKKNLCFVAEYELACFRIALGASLQFIFLCFCTVYGGDQPWDFTTLQKNFIIFKIALKFFLQLSILRA